MRDKSKPPGTRNEAGRVTHDDRGNAIWEWAISTGAFGVKESTPKPAKLDNPALALIEDEPPAVPSTLKGYSPYDSGVLGKKEEPPRKKDLRKLSEWLKLKQQADLNKSGGK